jgi:hypothetical protein
MNTPPPLFRAITDITPNSFKCLGLFPFIEDAKQALIDLLDEQHEGIAFEADHYHERLDQMFWATSKVVKEF